MLISLMVMCSGFSKILSCGATESDGEKDHRPDCSGPSICTGLAII